MIPLGIVNLIFIEQSKRFLVLHIFGNCLFTEGMGYFRHGLNQDLIIRT